MHFELRWYADGASYLLSEVWDSKASEPSRAAKFCSAYSSTMLSYLCGRVAETLSRLCADTYLTLLLVLKSHELAFLCSSRDASNERINSIYFCRKHKKPGSVLHKDLNAICSLITQTKWRVYLPFLIWHAFCHVEFLGHVQKQQLKIDRLSIYMYNPRVHVHPL